MRPVRRVLVALCFALIIYGLVWQRIQELVLGYQISYTEGRKQKLIKEHRHLWLELCRLRSVERVETLVQAELNRGQPTKVRIIEVVGKRP